MARAPKIASRGYKPTVYWLPAGIGPRCLQRLMGGDDGVFPSIRRLRRQYGKLRAKKSAK